VAAGGCRWLQVAAGGCRWLQVAAGSIIIFISTIFTLTTE